MSSTQEELLQHCVNAVGYFKSDDQSVEIYINSYLRINEIYDENDVTFITEIFCGVYRYPLILSVILDGYYAQVGQNALRSDQSLYQVLCYVALFRLEELGMDRYKEMIMCNDTNRMYKLTNFVFNEKNLITWMKCEWCKHYDEPFVHETILNPILKNLPALRKIVKCLESLVKNKTALKKNELKMTEVQPFSLTKVKPRKIPMPEIIPQVAPSQPPPSSTYKKPPELSKIARARVVNRRNAEETLMLSSKRQIRCANPDKSDKTKSRILEIETQEEANLMFEHFKANDKPAHDGKDVSFKLNTAAILREGQLYKEREQQTIKELNELEAGYSDISKFMQWQRAARQKEYDEQLALIEKRRHLGKMSYEEAILARQNVTETNRVKVQQMRTEAAAMMEEILEKRLKEEQIMRQLVEDTMEGHNKAREAKQKLYSYKQKLVQEMNEESKEMMRKALEKAEEEMRKKMLLINEIRAMESTPVNRHKLVDLASVTGYGFLNEMSILELRERLALMKVIHQEKEDVRRDSIIQEKSTKNQALIDTIGMISKHRDEMCKASTKSLEQKKNRHLTAPRRSEKSIEMEEELRQLRVKRKQAQEKNRLVTSKTSLMRRAEQRSISDDIEKTRWRDLEDHERRIAKLTSHGAKTGCDIMMEYVHTLT